MLFRSTARIEDVRPGGRRLVADGFERRGQPFMLTEFGGIAYARDEAGTWGYVRARTAKDLAARYEALLGAVHRSPHFIGFCYTQFADTFQEANGLLTGEREPKFPLERIAAAVTGGAPAVNLPTVS